MLYTVTLTANRHIEAKTEQEARDKAVTELPVSFDLIDAEVKTAAEQEE